MEVPRCAVPEEGVGEEVEEQGVVRGREDVEEDVERGTAGEELEGLADSMCGRSGDMKGDAGDMGGKAGHTDCKAGNMGYRR